jgi:hypothetical protein
MALDRLAPAIFVIGSALFIWTVPLAWYWCCAILVPVTIAAVTFCAQIMVLRATEMPSAVRPPT